MRCPICKRRTCTCAAKWDDGELICTDRGIITLNDLAVKVAYHEGQHDEHSRQVQKVCAEIDDIHKRWEEINRLHPIEKEMLSNVLAEVETRLQTLPVGAEINFEEVTGNVQ
jgi:hypothetical protein